MHSYPTPQHERAAVEITSFFEAQRDTQAVLLTNSCARGMATADSCLDLQVLASADRVSGLEQAWDRFAAECVAITELNAVGRWTEVHLDISDGVFEVLPIEHELDWLEVAVGNFLAYSVVLHERGPRLGELRAEWLPFYSDGLRDERLPAACEACLGCLERIPWYLDRELWFQALARLHGAFHWFLLAVHIEHRVYPIAYDKWIREQIVENLSLPELYERLPALFEIHRLESRELEQKAQALRALVGACLFVNRSPKNSSQRHHPGRTPARCLRQESNLRTRFRKWAGRVTCCTSGSAGSARSAL